MQVVSEYAEGHRSPERAAARRYADSTQELALLTQLCDAINAAAGSLIFTMTTRSADTIAHAFQQHRVLARALHSRLRPTQRRELLRRFARHDLEALVAPMVLDEGVDVPEADLAVIVAAMGWNASRLPGQEGIHRFSQHPCTSVTVIRSAG